MNFRLHNRAAQKKPRLILFWWNQLKDWFSGAAAIDTVAVWVIQLHLRFRASLDSNPIKVKVKLATIVEGKNWPHLKIRSTWSDWSFSLSSYSRTHFCHFCMTSVIFIMDITQPDCSFLSYHRTLPKVLKDQSRPMICHQQACHWQHHTKLFSRLRAKVTKLQKCLVWWSL